MLISLTHLNGASSDNAQLVTDQLMAVIIRVPAVRPFAVEVLTDLLLDQRLLGDSVAFQSNKMFKALSLLVLCERGREATRKYRFSLLQRSDWASSPALWSNT